MNLAITGGAGFIGSHMAEYLVKQNHKVLVIDNLKNGNLDNLKTIKNEIEFFKVDILDYESLKNILKNIDGVFHEAGLTSVKDSFTKQKEYHDVNVKGTENLFKLAKEFGFKVVFASSASVYGMSKKIPIAENSERNPINPYGKTKFDAEILSEQYAKMNTSIIGLRYFNVYGLRQNIEYSGVITKFLERIAENKPPIIHGDGLQIRDFVYVGDVVKANLAAMQSKTEHAIINIGSGMGVSINDLANIIIKLSGLKFTPIYDEPQEGDIRESQADITLAKSLLKWVPQTKLIDWLKDVIPKIQKAKKFSKLM